MFKSKYLFLFLGLFLVSCSNIYEYDFCEEGQQQQGTCERIRVNKIPPSTETIKICNPNYLNDGARSECEQVPVNQLLSKGGTDKKYCNGHELSTDFVDNWWNAEGLIDECEMPVNANMQFIFKRHNQSIISHTGTIQVVIQPINYDSEFKAMQIFIGEDSNNDNLPDSWIHCGNVDEIGGASTRNIWQYFIKVIHCSGNNLKFVKLVNAPWNKGNLFIDSVEVLKVG